MKQKNLEYQENITICVARIREIFPDANINRLDHITIQEKKNLSFQSPTEYENNSHTIFVDPERIEEVEDQSNAMMYGVLEAITTNPETKNQGVSFDGKMEAVNKGITHMIANLLIPSRDENDTLFTSYVASNILTNIAEADTVLDCYFHSDGKKLYNKLLSKLNNDPIYLDTMLEFIDIEAKTLSPKDRRYPSLLGYIQNSISQKYFENNDLSLKEMEEFHDTLFTEPKLAPESQISRLNNCRECDNYVKEQIELKKETSYSSSNKRNAELMSMFDPIEIEKIDTEGKKVV